MPMTQGMKRMSAIEVRTAANSDAVVSSTRGDFVVLFALAAMVLQSVLSIAILIAAPDLVRSPVIWGLWTLAVVVTAVSIVVSRQVATVPTSS